VLDGDGAHARDLELLEVADHDAGLLLGDVAEDHVAVRLRGRPVEMDDVEDRGRGGEELERPVGLLLRGHDAEVDHAA
jgi:hypothetical protein